MRELRHDGACLRCGGEITTDAYIEVQDLVRQVIRDIGYTKAEYRFDCGILLGHIEHPFTISGHRARRGLPAGPGTRG